MAEPLELELQTYAKLLPSLMKDDGKFALIYKDSLLGVFTAYEDALKAGYTQAKLEPFLVKKISGVETVAYLSRDLSVPCHTAQP